MQLGERGHLSILLYISLDGVDMVVGQERKQVDDVAIGVVKIERMFSQQRQLFHQVVGYGLCLVVVGPLFQQVLPNVILLLSP